MSNSQMPTSMTMTAASPRPDCPMLNAEHGKWLKDNFFAGYIQAVDDAKAKKPNVARVQGPGKDFVTNHILHPFIEHFWTHANEPNTGKVKKYLENHYKTFDKNAAIDIHTQPPPPHRTNAKEQFRIANAEQISDERTRHAAERNIPNDLDLYREVISDMWEAASASELDRYTKKAEDVNTSIATGPTVTEVYKLQPYLPEATEAALSRLIGFRHNQFGKVAWVAHCVYEDEQGVVQHKACVIFRLTWSAIPDNALQNEEYRTNVCTWAARGFDADKETAPNEGQKPSQELSGDGDKLARMRATRRSKMHWEKADQDTHNQAEKDAHDKAEEDERKKAEKKKSNGKGGCKRKADIVEADNVNTDISSPPKSKKSRSRPPMTTSEMAPDASSGPRRSVRTGKGENPNNYKLAAGKYKGK
ncbi:hypothetical protein EV421DRAFT_1905513 [Armillaria borealis]|uniref:Uncharacterized protein n=1 Tax=Armillaria borealis TaxID=47425 RepID=A0AA39MN33_9AGAR|nr:hypothetical protein EV421DRAFT_1905513 [Armillaria borealis]